MQFPYSVGTILRHTREQTLWMLASISLSGLPVLSEIGTDRQSLFTRADLVNYFEVIG